MTRTMISLTAAALMGTAAFAADADMSSIDVNGDGNADYAEFTALYPQMTPGIFAAMDQNGNGVVGDAEFYTETTQAYLENFGRNPGEYDVTADLDGDGNITFDELNEIAPGIPADTYAEMDRNNDGNLDLIEYNTAEAQAVLNAWEESVIFIRVSDYDANGDGVLSIEELRVALPNLDPADLELIPSTDTASNDGRALYRPVAKITQ